MAGELSLTFIGQLETGLLTTSAALEGALLAATPDELAASASYLRDLGGSKNFQDALDHLETGSTVAGLAAREELARLIKASPLLNPLTRDEARLRITGRRLAQGRDAAQRFAGEEGSILFAETMANAALTMIRGLKNGDQKGLEKICRNLEANRKTVDLPLDGLAQGSPEHMWRTAVNSSAGQVLVDLTRTIILQQSAMESGRADWLTAIEQILAFERHKNFFVAGPNGFRVPTTHRELAAHFLEWVDRNFPERRWMEGTLELHSHTGPLPSTQFFKLENWPPNPETDFLLKKYLSILGWSMVVRTAGEETTVTLEFGKTLRPATEGQKPYLKPDGKYDIHILTPEVTQQLPVPEKLALAKQLIDETTLLCSYFHAYLGNLKQGDRETLQNIETAFYREAHRLKHLFAFPEDPALTDLIKRLMSSAGQLTTTLNGALEIAVIRAKDKQPWNEVMAIIRKVQEVQRQAIPITLVANCGYRVPQNRRELAGYVVNWLKSANPQQSWKDPDTWKLVFAPDARPKNGDLFLSHTPWPADPDNLTLKTLLEILGWKMTVSPDGTEITVAFGRNAYKTRASGFDPRSLYRR